MGHSGSTSMRYGRGAPRTGRGDRRQTTVWDVPNLNPFGGSRDGENAVSGHGTQKPVRLWERPILHHTTTRDTLYDPFCGSGTAVIAAEKTVLPSSSVGEESLSPNHPDTSSRF